MSGEGGGGGRGEKAPERVPVRKRRRATGARGELVVRVSLQSIGKNISARCAIARVRGRVGRGAVRRPRRGRGVERGGPRSRVVARTSSCRRRRRFRPRPRPRSRAPTHPRVCCWSRDPRAEEARVARELPRRRPRVEPRGEEVARVGHVVHVEAGHRGRSTCARSGGSRAGSGRRQGGFGRRTLLRKSRAVEVVARNKRRRTKRAGRDAGERVERFRRGKSRRARAHAARGSTRGGRLARRVSSRPPTGSRAGGRRTANRNAPLRRAQNFCLTTTARRRLRASPGAPPEPTRGLDPRADRARREPRRVRSRRGCRRDTRAGNAGVAAADVSSRRRRRATAEPPSFSTRR